MLTKISYNQTQDSHLIDKLFSEILLYHRQSIKDLPFSTEDTNLDLRPGLGCRLNSETIDLRYSSHQFLLGLSHPIWHRSALEASYFPSPYLQLDSAALLSQLWEHLLKKRITVFAYSHCSEAQDAFKQNCPNLNILVIEKAFLLTEGQNIVIEALADKSSYDGVLIGRPFQLAYLLLKSETEALNQAAVPVSSLLFDLRLARLLATSDVIADQGKLSQVHQWLGDFTTTLNPHCKKLKIQGRQIELFGLEEIKSFHAKLNNSHILTDLSKKDNNWVISMTFPLTTLKEDVADIQSRIHKL